MQPSFYGLLDFTGIPVGIFPSPSPVRGTYSVAGRRRMIRAMIAQQMQRSILDRWQQRDLEQDAVKVRIGELEKHLEEAAGKRRVEAAIYSVVLSEV